MNSDPKASLPELESRIGYSFQNPDLLLLALTHPSWAQDLPQQQSPSNQRLEFLGDSVLGLLIAEQLYQDFPHQSEGTLTKHKSLLVKGSVLVNLAESIHLEHFLRLGSAERNSGERGRASRLEDALEAIFGAAYLDGGIPAARAILQHLYQDFPSRLQSNLSQHNAKGRLQELVQNQGGSPQDIQYHLAEVSGPDHQRLYSVHLLLHQKHLGSGSGPSRKEAENQAALQALHSLSQNHNCLSPEK